MNLFKSFQIKFARMRYHDVVLFHRDRRNQAIIDLMPKRKMIKIMEVDSNTFYIDPVVFEIKEYDLLVGK